MQCQQEDLAVYFESIENMAQRMLRLLKRLSDTGGLFRARLKRVDIDMNEFIKGLQVELNRCNPGNVVRVEIHNNTTSPVASDPTLLSLIVLNLMENSIVFRSAEDPFVKCLISNDNDVLTIQVIDNGIGISLDNKDRIFDMFYRGSEKSIGNGLGLFMVKKSLEILEGTIGIESWPQKLTTVTVRIPLPRIET